MKNKTVHPTSGASSPALIFIPDISGFTRFVTETEISHSQHIIEELLELMLDANDLGLQVSEIEGDAILFYRFGPAPSATELWALIQKMFVQFHTHLKKYETHRICRCGACKAAHQLSLKFIAHYGVITMNTIKEYHKLFGKEVIVAHRLLKNSIEHHEYAMLTHTLVQACPQLVEIEMDIWAPLQHGHEAYDSGKISYCYVPLAPLKAHIPALSTEDYSISGAKISVLHCEGKIEAPLDLVFNVYADLPLRSQWIAGAMAEVDHLNHEIFQSGSTHHCLADIPVITSHDFITSEELVTFTETDAKKTMCAVYTLRKLGPYETRVEAEWFLKQNYLLQVLFCLFTKNKLRRGVEASINNLNAYCKALLESGKTHRYKIIL